jgi:hypothetical protein
MCGAGETQHTRTLLMGRPGNSFLLPPSRLLPRAAATATTIVVARRLSSSLPPPPSLSSSISPAVATGRTAGHRHPWPTALPRRLTTAPPQISPAAGRPPPRPSLYPPTFGRLHLYRGKLSPNPKCTSLLRHLHRWPRRRWLRGAAASLHRLHLRRRPVLARPEGDDPDAFIPETALIGRPTPARGCAGRRTRQRAWSIGIAGVPILHTGWCERSRRTPMTSGGPAHVCPAIVGSIGSLRWLVRSFRF